MKDPAAGTELCVEVRGRPLRITHAELEAELEAEGPCRSLALLYAIARAATRDRAVDRLRRAIASSGPGALTVETVFQLVRLEASSAAPELRALAGRLGGSPGAIVDSAAWLVEQRVAELAAAAAADPLLARWSPQPYLHLPRVPGDAPRLFAAWRAALSRSARSDGTTAHRALLGDVAEAAFRSLQLGADPGTLLPEGFRGELVDAVAAELPGTADFLAARAMTWLLGALAPGDDAARSAIERACSRFHAPAFQRDCLAILGGAPWPPVPPPY